MILALQAAFAASAQGVELVGMTNHTWRYFTNGTDPGAGWAAPGFDDSSWPQGRGLFGVDSGYPYPFVSVFDRPSLGGPAVVFFRTTFNWASHPRGVIFWMTNYFDDGVVIYLNGVELTRYNMPAGPVDHTTMAPGTLTEPVVRVHQLALDSLTNWNANPLVTGTNVLAASVHNNAATSSDTVFGLSLSVGECLTPFTDGLQPTNRTVLEGRSTTFVISPWPNCCIPVPTLQWYRNVGLGEEWIPGATASSYTLTNAQASDAGVYYCRLTTPCGTVDSRRAVLDVFHYDSWPQFLAASIVGPGSNTFRLTTDHELCGDRGVCGGDFSDGFNWQIVRSDDTSVDLRVTSVSKINPTTYEFTTELPRHPSKLYWIMVIASGEVSDVSGNFVPSGTFAQTYPTLILAQGVAGYTGTQDAEIHSQALADTPLGAATVMKADLDDAGGVAQSLLRFDNCFGFGANQILPGSRIRSATLSLNQVDAGSLVSLHRMLVDWDQSIATWNSLMNGVSADDVDARIAPDATKPVGMANGRIELDVAASVQAWANGQPNYGWVFLPAGADGWSVVTSESGASNAPMLTVVYEIHGDVCEPAINIQPPPSIFAVELQTVVIAAGVTNTFFPVFQWTKSGVDIPGANQPTYVIQSASPLDAGTYRLRMSCATDSSRVVISSPTVLTVFAPPSRPYVSGVAAQSDGLSVKLHFSKELNVASAQNAANYMFIPPLAVFDAVYSNGFVTLTTAPREAGSNYTLRIANLVDASATPNVLDPNPTFSAITTARVIVPWDAGWHYNTNNLNATPAWKNPDFIPGADWGTGRGLLGHDTSSAVLAAMPVPIATPLTPNNVAPGDALVTTYFRKAIDLPPLPMGARYVICHYTDDGFIAYLDGREIHRFAMPAGAVAFTDRSTAIPSGDATLRSFSFIAAPGTHMLAVELHQAGITSTDVLFGMEVRMVDATVPALSIARTVNGGVTLNWNADNSWRLRSAGVLAGPYLDVVVPVRNRLGTYTFPAASVTNRSFWLLDYIGEP